MIYTVVVPHIISLRNINDEGETCYMHVVAVFEFDLVNHRRGKRQLSKRQDHRTAFGTNSEALIGRIEARWILQMVFGRSSHSFWNSGEL